LCFLESLTATEREVLGGLTVMDLVRIAVPQTSAARIGQEQ
jgi:hypothetical protein